MKKVILNDLSYDFEPFKEYQPDPNYKVDEEGLRKSQEQSQDILSLFQEYNEKKQVGA